MLCFCRCVDLRDCGIRALTGILTNICMHLNWSRWNIIWPSFVQIHEIFRQIVLQDNVQVFCKNYCNILDRCKVEQFALRFSSSGQEYSKGTVEVDTKWSQFPSLLSHPYIKKRKKEKKNLIINLSFYEAALRLRYVSDWEEKCLIFPTYFSPKFISFPLFFLVSNITIHPSAKLSIIFASLVSSQVSVLPNVSWHFFFMWLLTLLFPFVCSCQSISPHCGNLPAWYCNLLFPNKLFSPTYVLLPVSMTPAKILRLLLFFLKCLHADSCSGVSLYAWSLFRLWKCSPLPEFLRNTGLKLAFHWKRNEEERKLTDPWAITVCSAWGFLSPSLPGYNMSQVGHFLITVILCLLGLVVYWVTQPCSEEQQAGWWWWYPLQKAVSGNGKALCNEEPCITQTTLLLGSIHFNNT